MSSAIIGKSCTALLLSLCLSASLSLADETGDLEKLRGAQVDGYLKGNTVYVDILPGEPFGEGGLSPFYFAPDGRFAAEIPTGKLAGSWSLSETASYCVHVDAAGKTFCTEVVRSGDRIEHHSVGLKRNMGAVERIVPGNAAAL